MDRLQIYQINLKNQDDDVDSPRLNLFTRICFPEIPLNQLLEQGEPRIETERLLTGPV